MFALVLVASLAVLGCAGGSARPTVQDWVVTWTDAQSLVPRRASLEDPLDDERCSRVLVSLREVRDRLVPSPDELVDSAARAWLAQAEHMFFECFSAASSDRPAVAYATLERLRHQVDEALASAASSLGDPAVGDRQVDGRSVVAVTAARGDGGGRVVG
ncbi:hypothetical protein [Salsipaludibacter albus]|uniref:hypothetical protein n=1 Tax=Salsipaludibacter albus TaxID=2849650 RepID=UPI001EE49BC7|nr:hypothetical protein [Salsipaludibacter albus]MBY5162654.1 hypothetical protein [Salsipaludibacter albus]